MELWKLCDGVGVTGPRCVKYHSIRTVHMLVQLPFLTMSLPHALCKPPGALSLSPSNGTPKSLENGTVRFAWIYHMGARRSNTIPPSGYVSAPVFLPRCCQDTSKPPTAWNPPSAFGDLWSRIINRLILYEDSSPTAPFVLNVPFLNRWFSRFM